MKALRFVAATLACTVCILAIGQAEIIEQVLVKVNGEIFTKTDLETRQVSALRSMGRLDANNRPTDMELRKLLDEVTPQLIVSVVDELLLVQRGKELGYSLSDEQFKSIVDNIKTENKWDETAFQAALKQENISMTDLRRNLERQMMVSNVTRNEVTNKLTVSQEEMRVYYEAHVKDFTTSPTITLREVLVSVPAGAAAGVETEARSKAESVRTRASAGESFETLATQLSSSPSRASGGLIGPLNLEDLAPQIREALEPLKPGEMTAVLRTSSGFQVLKLESMTERNIKPFDQAKDQINEKVYTEKERTETKNHIEKLRQQSIIEWKSPELKKAYDTGMAQLTAAAAPAK